GILALTRTFVLKIEIEGTVRVKLERHPATDGKPIEWVRNREALRIIKCSRPKGVCRGRRAVAEMNRIFVCPIERFAGVVAEVEGIYGIFGNIRTQPELRNDGALEIVVAVATHCVGVHRPAIDDAR